jgi:hypothetical protein
MLPSDQSMPGGHKRLILPSYGAKCATGPEPKQQEDAEVARQLRTGGLLHNPNPGGAQLAAGEGPGQFVHGLRGIREGRQATSNGQRRQAAC